MDREETREVESRVEPRKVYVEKVDSSGTGWAVAMIVMVMAIGFGFLFYSNQQTANQVKIEKAFDDLRDENKVAEAPEESTIKVDIPKVEMPEVNLPDVKVPNVQVNTGDSEPVPSDTTDNTAQGEAVPVE